MEEYLKKYSEAVGFFYLISLLWKVHWIVQNTYIVKKADRKTKWQDLPFLQSKLTIRGDEPYLIDKQHFVTFRTLTISCFLLFLSLQWRCKGRHLILKFSPISAHLFRVTSPSSVPLMTKRSWKQHIYNTMNIKRKYQ